MTERIAEPKEAQPRSVSRVLLDVANERRERVSIGDLERALHGRSFGPFMVVFALPNLLPFPPGTSTILGIPLLFIAWQLVIGRREVWLAPFLRKRSISHLRYRTMLARALPRLRRIERMMRPRRWPFAPGEGGRIIGLFALTMAVMTVVPLPFANWLPAAASLCVGIAMTARDGVWLWAGVAVGVVALVAFLGLAILTSFVFTEMAS